MQQSPQHLIYRIDDARLVPVALSKWHFQSGTVLAWRYYQPRNSRPLRNFLFAAVFGIVGFAIFGWIVLEGLVRDGVTPLSWAMSAAYGVFVLICVRPKCTLRLNQTEVVLRSWSVFQKSWKEPLHHYSFLEQREKRWTLVGNHPVLFHELLLVHKENPSRTILLHVVGERDVKKLEDLGPIFSSALDLPIYRRVEAITSRSFQQKPVSRLELIQSVSETPSQAKSS